MNTNPDMDPGLSLYQLLDPAVLADPYPLLTLLRNPEQMALLDADHSLIPSAVEEMLRYEPPVQHTARIAPEDTTLGGKEIRKGQSVIAVMAAGNRDPERFRDPDLFDIERTDNRHLAFGWAGHFCFGAPLARMGGQIAFSALLRRLSGISLMSQPLEWRENLGLRGLRSLPVSFKPRRAGTQTNQRQLLSTVS